MTAASYWSLLEPAIEMCKESGVYGSEGQFAFVPVAVGFLFGAIFVFGTDKFLDYLGINSTNMMMSEYYLSFLLIAAVGCIILVYTDTNAHCVVLTTNFFSL